MMNIVSAAKASRLWIQKWNERLARHGVKANARVPESDEINKAVTHLEGPTHVASLTVWGTGMVEFIVLDLASQEDVVVRDEEFHTVAELEAVMDRCGNEFVALVRQ